MWRPEEEDFPLNIRDQLLRMAPERGRGITKPESE
jgi:hypothetical protein